MTSPVYNRFVPHLYRHLQLACALALAACSSSDDDALEQPIGGGAAVSGANGAGAGGASAGGGAGGSAGAIGTGGFAGAGGMSAVAGSGGTGAMSDAGPSDASSYDDAEIDAAIDGGPDVLRPCGAGGACVGIFYHTWHCPTRSPVYNLAKILAGTEQPGPVPAFHWWDEPELGFYCLAENDDALRAHATTLRDAGIDFVFVDVTNHPSQAGSEAMIQNPYTRLMEVWSTIAGAPKVVPWVYLKTGSNMIDFLIGKVDAYPSLQFLYQGKPLIIVRPQDLDTARVSQLEGSYTVRQMWGLAGGGTPETEWSFLQPCQPGFRESGGTIACQQRSAMRDGAIEQVSISAAYQSSYMSDTATATPKFGGDTLRRQFATLFEHPEVPIATITGWNEWVAQRYCRPGVEGCSFEESVFVDQYNAEFSRDIEPGGPDGDFYLRLMTSCIRVYRQALDCSTATGELCCQ